MNKHLRTAILSLFFMTGIQYVSISQGKEINELVRENEFTNGDFIRIFISNKNLNIKVWDQPKVRLALQVKGDIDSLKKTDWLDAFGINFHSMNSITEILFNRLSGYQNAITYKLGEKQNSALNTQGEQVQIQEIPKIAIPGAVSAKAISPENNKKIVIEKITLFIPEFSRLELSTSNSSILISGNISEGLLKLYNTVLDAFDADKMRIIAELSNINFHNIREAVLELFNGCTFRAATINALDIDSKSSSIEYDKGNSIFLRSAMDSYAIDEIEKVEGRKNYGTFRIQKLKSKLDIEGKNTDIKVREISAEAELIKVNTSFADLRLPVTRLSNYQVNFEGEHSSVFAPFDIIPLTKDEIDKKINTDNTPKSSRLIFDYNIQLPKSPPFFKAFSGNLLNNHTRFELICHQCTVDFK